MEIERKFFIKEMPDVSKMTPIRYERYYLRRDVDVEERIQKKGDKFEYEIKKKISDLERTKDKRQISEEEFYRLKPVSGEVIIRDSYKLSNSVSIKIYHGRFEGLRRAEVEFDSKEDALAYTPESWMGEEITTTPLGKDSLLLGLSQQEFLDLLNK